MAHKHQNEKLQQEYLIAERKERERLTNELVDENAEWNFGGFD